MCSSKHNVRFNILTMELDEHSQIQLGSYGHSQIGIQPLSVIETHFEAAPAESFTNQLAHCIGGVIETVKTCTVCQLHTTIDNKPFKTLQVNVRSTKSEEPCNTIERCIHEFTKPETLQLECSNCQRHTENTLTRSVSTLKQVAFYSQTHSQFDFCFIPWFEIRIILYSLLHHAHLLIMLTFTTCSCKPFHHAHLFIINISSIYNLGHFSTMLTFLSCSLLFTFQPSSSFYPCLLSCHAHVRTMFAHVLACFVTMITYQLCIIMLTFSSCSFFNHAHLFIMLTFQP